MLLDGLTGNFQHDIFPNLLETVHSGDLLVFNDTRVIPARLYGCKVSGGKIELLVERILDNRCVLSHIKSSRRLRIGTDLLFGSDKSLKGKILSRNQDFFEVQFFSDCSVLEILNNIGHMPLPPYINRADEKIDWELYQTVYNQTPGA